MYLMYCDFNSSARLEVAVTLLMLLRYAHYCLACVSKAVMIIHFFQSPEDMHPAQGTDLIRIRKATRTRSC